MYPHAAYAQAQAAMASAAAGQATSAGEAESSKSYPDMQVDPALAGEEGGEAWSMAQKVRRIQLKHLIPHTNTHTERRTWR